MLVLVAHAPHSGNDFDTIDQWWLRLARGIPNAYQSWPLILLCDANADVGQQPSTHIGDFQPGRMDPKTIAFEGFVAACDLWLPATFSGYQLGEGSTWTHSSGNRKRLDYVGLPCQW